MAKRLSYLKTALCAAAALLDQSSFAAEEHKHGDHEHKAAAFQSISAGVIQLDKLISEVRSKTGKNDFEGLHETSDEVRATAQGLEARLGDVKPESKERYKFNTEQLKSLAKQLAEVHESKSKDDAEKVAKRMESIRDRLIATTQNK